MNLSRARTFVGVDVDGTAIPAGEDENLKTLQEIQKHMDNICKILSSWTLRIKPCEMTKPVLDELDDFGLLVASENSLLSELFVHWDTCQVFDIQAILVRANRCLDRVLSSYNQIKEDRGQMIDMMIEHFEGVGAESETEIEASRDDGPVVVDGSPEKKARVDPPDGSFEGSVAALGAYCLQQAAINTLGMEEETKLEFEETRA